MGVGFAGAMPTTTVRQPNHVVAASQQWTIGDGEHGGHASRRILRIECACTHAYECWSHVTNTREENTLQPFTVNVQWVVLNTSASIARELGDIIGEKLGNAEWKWASFNSHWDFPNRSGLHKDFFPHTGRENKLYNPCASVCVAEGEPIDHTLGQSQQRPKSKEILVFSE